eukprot:Gregarina_sp_Poly_1__2171@NODE_1578_length_3802_cov_127_223829_g1043_i0_p3_GENE_NODE_1578_length_3802_cov_127_223829_g1043_i0NODE_1578_length_3802_cov_127_223829_g1043_i0_p3_ORF_typecomplete_len198_score8_84Cytadhesin_P30/PF07271_11/0_15_NODE_1578_length_3802_cov_127_223829_g1043_i029443537
MSSSRPVIRTTIIDRMNGQEVVVDSRCNTPFKHECDFGNSSVASFRTRTSNISGRSVKYNQCRCHEPLENKPCCPCAVKDTIPAARQVHHCCEFRDSSPQSPAALSPACIEEHHHHYYNTGAPAAAAQPQIVGYLPAQLQPQYPGGMNMPQYPGMTMPCPGMNMPSAGVLHVQRGYPAMGYGAGPQLAIPIIQKISR